MVVGQGKHPQMDVIQLQGNQNSVISSNSPTDMDFSTPFTGRDNPMCSMYDK